MRAGLPPPWLKCFCLCGRCVWFCLLLLFLAGDPSPGWGTGVALSSFSYAVSARGYETQATGLIHAAQGAKAILQRWAAGGPLGNFAHFKAPARTTPHHHYFEVCTGSSPRLKQLCFDCI